MPDTHKLSQKRTTDHWKSEAIKCIKELESDKVFFYADPLFDKATFDYGPLYRFGDVNLFIYAGGQGSLDGIREALKHIRQNTPVGDSLKECSPASRFSWPEPIELKNLSIHGLFLPLAPPDWTIMTKLSRQVAGKERRFWLLCIGGNPVIEYRRFFTSRGAAPKYLAFSAFHCEQPDAKHYEWTSPLAKIIQPHAQAEPQIVVTDDFARFGGQPWPWAKSWTRFNCWGSFGAYGLPMRQPGQVQADDAYGGRTVIVRRSGLTPQTLSEAEAIVITPELHRQWAWPRNLKLIVLADQDYRPDVRTLRINGDQYQPAQLGCKRMEEALRDLDRLCGLMNVQRVASVQLGFEDEGPVLRQWRQQPGTIQNLTLHLDLPGNVEAFGPYVDQIIQC